jgi:cell division protein FtsI/penicillin-binding protein 2
MYPLSSANRNSPNRYLSRVRLVQVAGMVAFAAVCLKLVVLQIVWHEPLSKRAVDQFQDQRPISAQRGSIIDREGRLLATDLELVWRVIVDSRENTSNRDLAVALAPFLGRPAGELLGKLESREGWVRLADDVDEATRQRILAMLAERKKKGGDAVLRGVGFERTGRRYYPNGLVAGNLLGVIQENGTAVGGIEEGLDSLLTGVPGSVYLLRTASGRPMLTDSKPMEPPIAGGEVMLTIDERFQAVAEEELDSTVRAHDALGGQFILMDPSNGELLAMASWPPLDPNDLPGWYPEGAAMRPVSFQFEPGSTMKLITFAALVESGVVTDTSEVIPCYNGRYQVANRIIRDSNRHGYPSLSAANVFQKSSNIGTVVLAQRMERETLYNMIRRFGLGERTRVDFIGEVRGQLPRLKKWGPVEYSNIAIGQGVAVNGLQMAAAYGTLANGGRLVRPHIVKRVRKAGKDVYTEPMVIRQVLEPSTIETLRGLATGVVTHGTGRRAAVEGIQVLGKTGTAQKLNPTGGYSNSEYLASFIGLAPVHGRELVVMALIDRPRGRVEGGSVAAPLVSRALTRILSLENEHTDREQPLMLSAGEPLELPDLSGLPLEKALDLLPASLESQVRVLGSGTVISQSLPAGTYPLTPADLRLDCRPPSRNMPDLTGLSARDALRLLGGQGARITVEGEGVVRHQLPMAGAAIDARSTVRLVLGS